MEKRPDKIPEKLQEYRQEIDVVDENIVKLLEKRFLIVQKMFEHKKYNGVELIDKKREQEILNNLQSNVIEKKYLEKLFIEIIHCSKIQNSKKLLK